MTDEWCFPFADGAREGQAPVTPVGPGQWGQRQRELGTVSTECRCGQDRSCMMKRRNPTERKEEHCGRKEQHAEPGKGNVEAAE